jgi:hypothetical protein
MKKRKVEFSSHTGNLALMRKFVRGFLDAYPFSEKERTLMVLGVDEPARTSFGTRIIWQTINRSRCRWKGDAIASACDCVITAARRRRKRCRAARMI